MILNMSFLYDVRRSFLAIGLVLVTVFSVQTTLASIKLPAVVGDQMVLQRDIELKIWGWADPGEKITLRFRGNHYYTETDPQGKWSVKLPAQTYGGPFMMEINEIVIRDILIGDVWLCSGQSNMETPIKRLVERFPEINESNNHMIRYFKVPTQKSNRGPKEDIPSGERWHSAIASDVMNWTALAYFYAQESFQHQQVPVGMLVSSLGGSSIESWIDQKHLVDFPKLVAEQMAMDSLALAQQDQGYNLWTKSNFDDSAWPVMQVPGYLADQNINYQGVVYFRRSFEVPAQKEGRHAKLYLGTLVDSDSVFVNGHFVGATAYMYPPRLYDIPAGILRAGTNSITVRLRADQGNGGFTPAKSYQIKIDDVHIDLSGQWNYNTTLDMGVIDALKRSVKDRDVIASSLYDGMIYPLKDYQVKGVIWYQGEANTADPGPYAKLLTRLIQNWRGLFSDPDLPFLIVQLPNFMAKQARPSESNWAWIRAAQSNVVGHVPHTALAVTYDLGEWNDIHPLNKKDMAKRLLLCARKIAYLEDILCAGPTYRSMHIQKDKIVISFDHIGKGLKSRDGHKLAHFAIAGENRTFMWAEAFIKGNEIIVSHPAIAHPKAVRYAWSDNPDDANLENKNGLLAAPFRTDNW